MVRRAQLLVFVGFFIACTTAGAGTAHQPVTDSSATPDPTHAPSKAGESLDKPQNNAPAPVVAGLSGSFLSGRFATKNQDLAKAAQYINESLAHDPNNQHLQAEALRLNLLAGNMPIATDLAKKLSAQKENDPLIASLLMLDDVKAGDYVQARTVINNAPGTGLFGLIRPVIVAWLTVGAGETKAPVTLQAAIDKSGFFAPFLTYHSALMNDVLGYNAEAEAAYHKASADPATVPYRVVQALANFYARSGKWDEAQKAYDAYAKANPSSSLIPEKLTPGTPPKPMVPDAKAGLAELYFTTASLLFSDDRAQDTFLYLRIALELRPNLPPGQLMLANLYEQTEDYAQAIKVYDGIAEGNVFYRRAQVRKALNYEALGDKPKAIELLDAVAKKYPDDATALITKGDLEREAEEYPSAIAAYSAAITRSEPLIPGDWPLLYARGISYERAGNWDAAEADFQHALNLSPNQPDVLNYLGYSWLVAGKNVGKAREYLDQAYAARPNDAHIVDSVGWAHYLSGDFQGAADMFVRALQSMPNDPTVTDHLGDAYWRLGRETEARYQWEQALAFKPEKDEEASLHTKLEKGLPAFVAPVAEAPKPNAVKADSGTVEPLKTQVQ